MSSSLQRSRHRRSSSLSSSSSTTSSPAKRVKTNNHRFSISSSGSINSDDSSSDKHRRTSLASGGSGGGSDTVVVINNTVLRDWESRIPTMTPKDLIDVCKNLFVFTANITASSALLDRVKISLANVISVDDKNYAILLAVEETIKSQYALWSKKNGSVNNIVNIMFNINPKPSAGSSSQLQSI